MADRSEVETATQIADAGAEARKMYTAPILRRLGSVRELTLGSSGCAKEAKAFFMAM
jgi:hypothetical protein